MKFPNELLKQCWFLAGPTASGKTATSIQLAKQINAEILSLDSMAVFTGMDIGTAKPSIEERDGIPHHLIDIVQPWEDFSTSDFMDHALTSVVDILERDRVPLFVGGTGLYLRAILRGVFEGPAADWEYRNQLEQQAAKEQEGWLHQQLQEIDPTSAQRLHPNDARRLIRALEIHRVTGQPASELLQEVELPPDQRPQHVYWLHPNREWLYDRINRRVDLMLEEGFVTEVDQLLKLDPPLSRTARQALGYRELIEWREGELESLEAATELIKTRTRQFAKRQHTWFRNLEECKEVAIQPEESAENIISRILTMDG